MKECLRLYHTSFTQYWRLYWLNQNFDIEIDALFSSYEIVDNIPFVSVADLESKPTKYRILFTLLKAFFTLEKYADRLSIMPKNEELDDVSTLRLAFVAIPYFLGFLLLELPTLDNRSALLSEAKLYLMEFGTRLSNLGSQFMVEIPGNRTDKVALARQDMDTRKKINHLLSLKLNNNTFDPAIDDIISPLFPNYRDEYVIRELTILLLTKFRLESLSHLQSIDRELKILGIKSKQSTEPTSPTYTNAIISNASKIPCMSDLRTRLQRNVFIPGHNMPTITLAECAKIEMDMELNIGKTTNGGRLASNSSDASSNDTNDAREWDNWKDDHPWGSGNKNRNIS
ncbi:TAP42-like family [Babesia microti strain RI]|uniref:TAP42-like family n=1 Tax=Babesia microti (strain RI) TaxID=1133968 RepID=A0A1R4A9V5_BABMR|nr:TAP42-like family [Babesia microti strain RI]SJK85764.1 TAP42-like family [Babesia microti strain RI]|eukprot:XP_021337987.1 TAP42-like family [Babesia microti strain RI]